MDKTDNEFTVNHSALVYAASIDGNRELIIDVSASVPPVLVRDHRFFSAICSLPPQFTMESAFKRWKALDEFDDELSQAVWALALEFDIIVTKIGNDPRNDYWESYGWSEAAVYHLTTRNYPFLKMDEAGAFDVEGSRMEKYVAEEPPPSLYQEFNCLESIELRKFSPDCSPAQIVHQMSIADRRSIMGLSILFDVCFGERRKVPTYLRKFGVPGEFLRKSIPSGGARHPTEVFFACFEESIIPPGVYHYNVGKNSLDLIRTGQTYEKFKFATYDLFTIYPERPVGCLIFTTLYERAMWRYRESRSWRAVLIDIGHAAMMWRKVASLLGFKGVTFPKVRDKEISELLGISALKQTPLLVATVV